MGTAVFKFRGLLRIRSSEHKVNSAPSGPGTPQAIDKVEIRVSMPSATEQAQRGSESAATTRRVAARGPARLQQARPPSARRARKHEAGGAAQQASPGAGAGRPGRTPGSLFLISKARGPGGNHLMLSIQGLAKPARPGHRAPRKVARARMPYEMAQRGHLVPGIGVE